MSLDETDDEPTRFWSYVLTALRGASDEISPAALDALAVPGADPMDLALPILLNELAASSIPHVLVLDDFHVLANPRIHEGVEFLVSYLPVSLRLVVAGRADPPLPIARLRARGELTELRAADLRLSRTRRPRWCRPCRAPTWTTRRPPRCGNGRRAGRPGCSWPAWPAGAAPRPGRCRAVRGDDRHLLDYFTAEVLPAITPEQRDLLVRAAPLERLSGSLCDAALQVTGSAEVLAALDRADLFLVALDAEHEWYRCHHLFRDVLAARTRGQVGGRHPGGPAPRGGVVRAARPDRRRGAAPAARR